MRSSSHLALALVTACALAAPAAAQASSYSDGVLADAPSTYLRMDTADPTLDATGNLTAAGVAGSVLTGQSPAFPDAIASAKLTGSGASVHGTLGASVKTVEMWIKPTTNAKHQPLIAYGDPSGDGWAIAMGGPGKRKVTFTSGGHATTSRLSLPVGAWTMLVVSWGDGAKVHMYANATTTQRNNPTAASGGIPVGAPSDPTLTVGAIDGRSLSAQVDEIALYPTTLSPTEIRAHYASSALPVSTQLPVVQGIPQVGRELTVVQGVWVAAFAPPYAYHWQRCDDADCVDISGATGSTYTLVGADEGMTIQVKETASNLVGSTTAISDDVGPIVGADAPTPDPVGSGSTASSQTQTSATSTVSTVSTTGATSAQCSRTVSVAKARRARVKGLGRVVLSGRIATVTGQSRLVVTLRAKRGTVASVTFRLNGKKVKRVRRSPLRTRVSTAGLRVGRHTLRAVIKPKHGKSRSVILRLRVAGC